MGSIRRRCHVKRAECPQDVSGREREQEGQERRQESKKARKQENIEKIETIEER